jgi:hypothetical protein
MLPVLSFFDQNTGWKFFPEYTLKKLEKINNVEITKIDEDGKKFIITIQILNLDKKSDDVIHDAIKTSFNIKSRFGTIISSDKEYEKNHKELLEFYNNIEWVPVILMVSLADGKYNINFKDKYDAQPQSPTLQDANPNQTPLNDNKDDTNKNDTNKNDTNNDNNKDANNNINEGDDFDSKYDSKVGGSYFLKGGKRNPDRERVYKLPIHKRRTDNYYNYE